MSNIFGRQVVVILTNKSGGGVIAGDVVVPDGANDSAFTTTTSAASTGPVWVAQETIASNASGRVLVGGYAALVNVNASVTRGHYGGTHTVAKQAASLGASRTAGSFCRFLTGGTTPIAYIWPTDLLGTSLTNPMANKGEMILGDTGGTPSALAAGTSRYVLAAAGAGNFPVWTAFSGARVYNSGTINLTNGSYTAITFDSEDYDTDSFHSTGSNTERLTIATTGKYRFGCGITVSGSLSTTQIFVEIVKNAGPTPLAVYSSFGITGNSKNVTHATEATLTATDYLWVRVFVNTASCTATRNSDWSPIFWIERCLGA